MVFKQYIRLLRMHQWYKNLIIFTALFFTGNLLNLSLLLKTILGAVSLCLVSSSYYIINDVRDADEDRNHPEKKNRPIASGEVKVKNALALSTLLFVVSACLAYSLSKPFAVFMLALFLLNVAYTLRFRDVPFVDLHFIAFGFLLRAVSGAVLINVPASPWLIMTVFFLALFLAIGKRRADLSLLGGEENAVKYRGVYRVYSLRLLDMMLVLVSSVLLFSYSLYSFMVHSKGYMMLTIPFASFMVFRYIYFALSSNEIARKTQYVFRDFQMVAALTLWVVLSYVMMNYAYMLEYFF